MSLKLRRQSMSLILVLRCIIAIALHIVDINRSWLCGWSSLATEHQTTLINLATVSISWSNLATVPKTTIICSWSNLAAIPISWLLYIKLPSSTAGVTWLLYSRFVGKCLSGEG